MHGNWRERKLRGRPRDASIDSISNDLKEHPVKTLQGKAEIMEWSLKLYKASTDYDAN